MESPSNDITHDRPTYRIMGDRALLVELGEEIHPAINRRVRKLQMILEAHPIVGILEMVPTYRSLLIVYDPLTRTFSEIRQKIHERLPLMNRMRIPAARTLSLPVCYGGAYGPDLSWVARHHGLTEEEVIRFHTGTVYRVYMLGFTPGYAYMGELPPEIVTPRRKTPRTHVPKGSVGIARKQTGIYPVVSPGGWQIIGRTPLELFDPDTWPPALLGMGDRVHFFEIKKEDMIHWPPSKPLKSSIPAL